MTTPRPLYEILPDMEAVVDGMDIETGHIKADNLLIEALESLADAHGGTALVDAIILAYRDVKKWYA